MEVEGKEEEKERGRENYFGSKLECLEGLVRVEYLRFDSSFRFLCRAEWRRMSLTMLTRGCFSFFFSWGEMEGHVNTARCGKKRSRKT